MGTSIIFINNLPFGIRLGRSQETLPPTGVNKGHVDKLGCLGNQCHLDSMALEVADRMSAKTMGEAAAVVYAAIRELIFRHGSALAQVEKSCSPINTTVMASQGVGVGHDCLD
jgi:hypothetical protein